MTADRIDAYELNRTLTVSRSSTVDDGQGGQSETFGDVGTVLAKVNEPTSAERIEAMRSGVDLAFTLHLLPDADVRRGDTLTGDGEVYRVKAVTFPSTRVYRRAECSRDQYEDE